MSPSPPTTRAACSRSRSATATSAASSSRRSTSRKLLPVRERATLLKPILHLKLEHPSPPEQRRDLPEIRRRHRLIVNRERRVIEEVAHVHPQIDRVPLRDLRPLQQAEVERRVPRSV